jgi:hypothetical protein
MDLEELLRKVKQNRLSTFLLLGGVVNALYALFLQNWLGLLISIAVIAYLLPDILNEED